VLEPSPRERPRQAAGQAAVEARSLLVKIPYAETREDAEQQKWEFQA
jgi:hypothetical protein